MPFEFKFPAIDSTLSITPHKTVRVKNDGKQHDLPASEGELEFFQLGAQRIAPIDQKEKALWLGFTNSNSETPVALKVLAGGINAITGEKETEAEYRTLRNNDEQGKGQNYMIVPGQQWLDGFMTKAGVVRQFVAVELGAGRTVEEKLEGTQRGGIQFVVIPTKKIIYDKKLAAIAEATRLRKAEVQQWLAEQECQRVEQIKAEILTMENALTVKEKLFWDADPGPAANQADDAEIRDLRRTLSTWRSCLEMTTYEERIAKIVEINNRIKEKAALIESPMLAPETVALHNKEITELKFTSDIYHRSLMQKRAVECFDTSIDQLQDMQERSYSLNSTDFHRGSRKSGAASGLLKSLAGIVNSMPKMGLAGGGTIKQQIVASQADIETFDLDQAQYMEFDLVSLYAYKAMHELPQAPRALTHDEYTNAGLPWFTLFSTQPVVKLDETSRLAGLEQGGTISAFPVETPAQPVPVAQKVALIEQGFFGNWRQRLRAALASTPPAAAAERAPSMRLNG